MNVDEKVLARLDELIAEGNAIVDSAIVVQLPVPVHFATSASRNQPPQTYAERRVKSEQAIQWSTSCRHILRQIFGNDSIQYKDFGAYFVDPKSPDSVSKALAVLNAAKDDFAHDMLFDTRVLIEAEVFDEFLEQADYLLRQDYYQPAAVVAGAVLEDGLRKLCSRHNIPLPDKPKLDTMNANLAKAGVYNALTQKNVTALADLRNKAAHGQWDQFTKEQVVNMLPQVRAFMAQYFS